MKIIRVIGTVVLLIAAVCANVQAYREDGGMEPGYGYGPVLDDRMLARLNLTAEQAAVIINLQDAHTKEIQPLQNELDSRRNELKQLWLQRTPDQSRITAVEREVRALRKQLRDKRNRIRRAVFSILTPEQRNRLQKYGTKGGDSSRKGMRDQTGMGMPPALDRGMRGY